MVVVLENRLYIPELFFSDSFLKETLRVTSGVFMVRYCSEDTDFEMSNGEKYTVRKGDRVAMYPPCIHMDPEIFEDPEVSIPSTLDLFRGIRYVTKYIARRLFLSKLVTFAKSKLNLSLLSFTTAPPPSFDLGVKKWRFSEDKQGFYWLTAQPFPLPHHLP